MFFCVCVCVCHLDHRFFFSSFDITMTTTKICCTTIWKCRLGRTYLLRKGTITMCAYVFDTYVSVFFSYVISIRLDAMCRCKNRFTFFPITKVCKNRSAKELSNTNAKRRIHYTSYRGKHILTIRYGRLFHGSLPKSSTRFVCPNRNGEKKSVK